MADIEEVLAKLTDERATYAAFLEAVDADLKIEKLKRIATRQGTIMHLVAEAFALGASKRSIMKAYGTKDFATINRMLESMQEQIIALKQGLAEVEVAAASDWFEMMSSDFLYIGETGYEVTALEDDEFMLIQVEGDPTEWDGLILTGGDEGKPGKLWQAILEKRY